MSSQQAKISDTNSDSNAKIPVPPTEIQGARAKGRLLLPQLSQEDLDSSRADGSRPSFVEDLISELKKHFENGVLKTEADSEWIFLHSRYDHEAPNGAPFFRRLMQ